MVKPNQLSFVAPSDVRERLERLSVESGRSVAALIREAVVQYLGPLPGAAITPDDLWRILQDPANWARFKALATEMEAATTSPVFEGAGAPAEAAPGPAFRYQRPEGVPPRAQKPDEPKPF